MPDRDATASEVEAVARAISDADGSDAWGAYTDMARAALDEVRAAGRAEDQYRRAHERWRDLQLALNRIAALEVDLAEARASLERERKARHAAERVNADEVLRKRTNLEARIEVAEYERDEAVARAENAEQKAVRLYHASAREVARAEKAEQREEWDKQERKRLLARAEAAERERDGAREQRDYWRGIAQTTAPDYPVVAVHTDVLNEVSQRAERAEADLAVCRKALEKIEDHLTNLRLGDGSAIKRSLVVTREALSRLNHSSEEER